MTKILGENTSRSLRICVMAHNCRVAGGVSVGRNLIASVGRVRPQHTYLFTVPAGLGYEEACAHAPRHEMIVYDHAGGLVRRWFWETYCLTRQIRSFRPEVIVGLGNRGLVHPPCPQAIFVQDAHLFYPRRHHGRQTLRARLIHDYHARHLRKSVPRTQLLLCQTLVAMERLRQTFHYNGPMSICPNAVSPQVPEDVGCAAMPEPLIPLADRFKLFCLSRYYAHKNLELLPELFERFGEQMQGVVVVTTISGDECSHAAKLLRRMQSRSVADHFLNVGPLPQSALAGYYRHCQAMFLPTLLESFTATYLEAMHFGLPILTSDLDFARVICDDAAVYFDPWDAGSIKDAILRLRNDAALAPAVVARGFARLHEMARSWDEIALATIDRVAALVPPTGESGSRDPLEKLVN